MFCWDNAINNLFFNMRITKNNPGNFEHHIRIDDMKEIKYWCTKLNSTPEELKNAIRKTGDSPDKVRALLDSELNIQL
jgi:hypothetical protein